MNQSKKVKTTITLKPESDRLFGSLFLFFFPFVVLMADNVIFFFLFFLQKHSRNIIRNIKLATERKLVACVFLFRSLSDSRSFLKGAGTWKYRELGVMSGET